MSTYLFSISTAYFGGLVVGDHASARVSVMVRQDSDTLSSLAEEIAGLRSQVGALCAQVDALCGLPLATAGAGGERLRTGR